MKDKTTLEFKKKQVNTRVSEEKWNALKAVADSEAKRIKKRVTITDLLDLATDWIIKTFNDKKKVIDK